MKDNNLEKMFDEYFKGANTPDNITDDAKKFVKPKKEFLPKFVKFASIAASFVVVIALTLTFALNKNPADKDGDSSAPSQSAPDVPSISLYSDSDLQTENKSAYSLSSLDSSLKFLQNFAYSSNSTVTSCSAGYIGGKLALVKADVSMLSNLNRDDTQIYVEFTETNCVYDKLSDYLDGEKERYGGTEYYITRQTGENGEPEFKLHTAIRGVKYYFFISSTNPQAYKNYLNLIIN